MSAPDPKYPVINTIQGISIAGLPSLLNKNLQYVQATNTFIWVPDAVQSMGMGDLEFIQSKVLSGDYFQVSGDIDAINDTIDFVVPDGKTAFLIEAKIVITGHTTPDMGSDSAPVTTETKNMIEAALKIDSAIKDITNIGFATITRVVNTQPTRSMDYGDIGDGKFNTRGLSLIGDGAKLIEIENILDNGTAFATLSGYLIDT